ncbi:MAG: DUF3990 domain-containing protein [Alistipes sp.]|nr:DUF3990 domain-containing protein [Alistipes sp.]
MILYHGSNTKIEKINLSKCKPYKDFGKGFYLTEIREQAEKMASRTAHIYEGEHIVTEFEFDESALSKLSVKQFDGPNEEWALFVLANRSKEHEQPTHSYDIVIGPVADDDIAQLFRNFNDGFINLTMLVEGLKYKKVSSQYFFHTEAAIKYLRRL